MRFFLVDKVTEMELHTSIKGVKAWSLDNPIFLDHFPGAPIVPGVLLTESMAQILGLLIEKSYYDRFKTDKKIYVILSIIQKAKFRNIVQPGDRTLLEAELMTLDVNRAVGKVKVYVEEKLMAEGTLSFTIGTHRDIQHNKYLERREEYLQILFKDLDL